MTTTLEPTAPPMSGRSPAAPEAPPDHDPPGRDAAGARRGGLGGREGLGRFVRGRDHDPVWVRPCLLALLLGTAVLYIWGLGASGWGNTYYSAAVQAATKSWKAFFFGSFDASNAVTVDKSPLSLWPMALSARVFGVNSWSILVPEALEGVAAVGVLYLAVRRWFSAGSALLAGAVLALTPVAALMFRFNNPDAALVLLLVASAYGMIRALERGSTWWLVFAFSMVGFGFLAKMLQALLVVPAFGLVYLIAAPVSFWKRVWQGAVAGAALLVSAGWWIAIVELWPASSRPYIGGSQHNSVLELIFGYNGFGRLTGNETGSVGGGGGGGTGSGVPPGSRACSTPSSAPRSRGCCRPRSSCSSRASCGAATVRAPTACAPRSSSGAAGSSSPGSCSASARGSSTSTTRSHSHRRSAHSWAWARECCGSGAPTCAHARCSR